MATSESSTSLIKFKTTYGRPMHYLGVELILPPKQLDQLTNNYKNAMKHR